MLADIVRNSRASSGVHRTKRSYYECKQIVNPDTNCHLRCLVPRFSMCRLNTKLSRNIFHIESQKEEEKLFWCPYCCCLAMEFLCGHHLNAKPLLYTNSQHDFTTLSFISTPQKAWQHTVFLTKRTEKHFTLEIGHGTCSVANIQMLERALRSKRVLRDRNKPLERNDK